LDEASANFFHGHPFELVWRRANDMGTVDARQRSAAQLLGTLRGDVYEQKSAGDWSGRLCRFAGARFLHRVNGLGHDHIRIAEIPSGVPAELQQQISWGFPETKKAGRKIRPA
jgi:hypothetical protein